ncbi:MAG: hypothetical protein ACI4SV_04785, partial [Duodenibacillus sp.]
IASVAALTCLVVGLGRPALLFTVFSDPTSRLFWKEVPLTVLAVSMIGYVAAHLCRCEPRVAAVWAVLAALAGTTALIAMGAGHKLPFRPVLDTDLNGCLFLCLLLPTASVFFGSLSCQRAGARGARVPTLVCAAVAIACAVAWLGRACGFEETDATYCIAMVSAASAAALFPMLFERRRLGAWAAPLGAAVCAAILHWMLSGIAVNSWHFF